MSYEDHAEESGKQFRSGTRWRPRPPPVRIAGLGSARSPIWVPLFPGTNREGGRRRPLGFLPRFVRSASRRPLGTAAEVLGDPPAALLAADRAAPVKLAVAAGHRLGAALLHRQPAVPAQSAAAAPLPAAQGAPAPQTLSALGALQPQGLVLQAVVGGIL